jgi:predicted DNA-binding transcriptional regulator YafY
VVLRAAIRDESKLSIAYRDEAGNSSSRVVWPLVLIYYVDAAMLVAWCELRSAIRHFRADRITACHDHPEHFAGQGAKLISAWEQEQKAQMVYSRE